MAGQRFVLAARSILLGWATLLAIVYLFEHPLLFAIAKELGGSWVPTLRVMLDCVVLAATGWAVGRAGRANPILAVAAFAATLSLWDFEDLVEIRIPWLLRLVGDALHDSRYWDSVIDTAVMQALLFGSLIVGGLLSRRAPAQLSIHLSSGDPPHS